MNRAYVRHAGVNRTYAGHAGVNRTYEGYAGVNRAYEGCAALLFLPVRFHNKLKAQEEQLNILPQAVVLYVLQIQI